MNISTVDTTMLSNKEYRCFNSFVKVLASFFLVIAACEPFQNALANSIAGSSSLKKLPDYRLPSSVYPFEYHIRLFVVLDPLPGFGRFTATGDVEIQIECVENTNQIYLHAVNLSISHDVVQVLQSDGQEVPVTSLTYELLNDFFIISLNSTLESGEIYMIKIHYVAPIPDYRLNGMYQDYYVDAETSEKRYVATTLFAPYHARRLFPCFDEPSFRANYSVEIAHHKKYHAMANEEVSSSIQVPGQPDYINDIFKTTPNISSYIVAMIVSDFTYETAPENRFSNKSVRIYAAPHLISLGAGEYAANVTDAVMAFLENRFQIKYPLDKLYSIALPHFFFSAMENIGLITYKEPVVLYLKNETTEEERYTINSVMSHELSHQWFGNIVACRFWSWVWLKEGFSTFYSHYGINHTNPELTPWDMFVPKVLIPAMNFDSSKETHPLENPPSTSAEVADIYTTIPYNKGASINRMTSAFLTESVFEEAMKIYLNRHQYSSADQYDLFASLQEAVDKNPKLSFSVPTSVDEIMKTWTLQSGFPLIKASRTDSSHITLTQEKFVEGEASNSSITWWVPITLQSSTQVSDIIWIPQGQSTVTVEVTSGEIIVNPDATGYYRVQYDNSLKLDILKLLQNDHSQIPAAGRSKLIDDYFQLALAGNEPIESAMDFCKYIHKDMSTAVWLSLQINTEEILKQLKRAGDDYTIDLLKDYLLDKISTVWTVVATKENESRSGSLGMLYELLIRWSCDLGSCVAISDEEIADFIAFPENWHIPKEKQFPLYCAANARDRSNKAFVHILREYSNSKTLFGRRQRLLRALTCTKNLDNLNWLIQEALDEESQYFSSSESGQILQLLVKDSISAEQVLKNLLENSSTFFNRYDNYVESILLDMSERISETRIDQVMNLVEQLQYSNPKRAQRIYAHFHRSNRRRAMLSESLAFKLRSWLTENM